MKQPWLDIPLADYERHMALPTVGQAQMLARELAAGVAEHSPRAVAVVGCAGGNGFDRLSSPVERVVGIDINPRFIEAARARYGSLLPNLVLHAADVQAELPDIDPVDLVYAALVLEYVDVGKALRSMATLCRRGGRLVIVLQRVSPVLSKVSPSPFTSLDTLGAAMQLHDPSSVMLMGEDAGFERESSRTVALPSGKEFAVLTLRRR